MKCQKNPLLADRFRYCCADISVSFPDVGFVFLFFYFIRNVKCGEQTGSFSIFFFCGEPTGLVRVLLFHSSRWVWEEAGCVIVRKKGADGMHPMLMDEQVTD